MVRFAFALVGAVQLASSHTISEYVPSSGTATLAEADWLVVLSTDGDQIRRDIWVGGNAWQAVAEGWEPEGIVWPTWPLRPANEMSAAESALSGIQLPDARTTGHAAYGVSDQA